MSSSYSRQQLETWIKTIEVPDGSKVIDIGGSQLPVKDRVKYWGASEYKILDLENPHESKHKPDFIFDINTLIPHLSLGDNKHWEHGYFDIAFCLEVSEYLWNPVQAFHNINALLRINALLVASFHFVYPIHQPKESDYMRYTRYGVTKILNETGFSVQEITPRFEVSGVVGVGSGVGQGKPSIMNWFLEQQMRPAKDYSLHNEIGYLVKAIKKSSL